MFKAKITKEEVNQLETAYFEGDITVIDKIEDMATAFSKLSRYDAVGIDTETKPSFTKGVRNKVSLLQISTMEFCYLFRLNKVGFTDEMYRFLGNENIIKIGLSLQDDFSGLYRKSVEKPKNFVDLQKIAQSYGILELSLQKIYAVVFGEKISKSQRLSNWDNETLTEAQQRYAATDAWACLKIFNRLKEENQLSKERIKSLIAEFTVDVNNKSGKNIK